MPFPPHHPLTRALTPTLLPPYPHTCPSPSRSPPTPFPPASQLLLLQILQDAQNVIAARQAYWLYNPVDANALQAAEDELPTQLLAWCRFMACMRAKDLAEGSIDRKNTGEHPSHTEKDEAPL